jgi:predicted nucleic acid-binding Zn ribbon protein
MQYSFKCTACEIEFDVIHQGFMFTSPDMGITCPQCHTTFHVVKVWKAPQVIYKGLGWASRQGQNSGKD